jgi:hypothetical protein
MAAVSRTALAHNDRRLFGVGEIHPPFLDLDVSALNPPEFRELLSELRDAHSCFEIGLSITHQHV